MAHIVLISAGLRAIVRSGLLLGLAVFAFPAHAQDAASTAANPALTETSARAIADGFRSARFGMDQDEVRAAISSDFGIEGEEIEEGLNRAERTQLLTVSVPDLLPEGGTAQVSYVFGYQSGTLIQVGISWNALTDPELTEDTLYSNADALAAHFAAAGYDPPTITTGLVLDSGILLFRGEDTEGHATILLLQGNYLDLGEGQQGLAPVSLAVLYAADAENPDVFTIEPGQF